MGLWKKQLVVGITFYLVPIVALQLKTQDTTTRRRFLEGAILTGSAWSLTSQEALAAKGAAEYDLEYYMRDLIGGNAKEGNVQASKVPPAAPPRTLTGPLLPLLLNDDCSPACVPTQALLQQLKSSSDNESLTITSRMNEYRDRASRSFSSRAPWKEPHVSDQYYFDLTSYALWRTAADLIPNYVQRDVFPRNIGRGIYQQATKSGLLKETVNKKSALTSTIPAIKEIMDMFQASRYFKSFRLGEKDQTVLFDQYDNEDLASGATVNCLVSVFEPASLGASLQITGEQSRFTPEFVGVTLAAMWEAAGIKASYETYFVDNEYRPNPKDFYPNEQLLQFSLLGTS
jgi:hypothetical protein